MDKQVTIEECMISRLRDLLARLSMLKGSRAIILYRNVIEENDDVVEEEIASISGLFVVVQVITYGGFMPPNIQQQFVLDINKFPEWAMKRGKEIFDTILSNLEHTLMKKYQ